MLKASTAMLPVPCEGGGFQPGRLADPACGVPGMAGGVGPCAGPPRFIAAGAFLTPNCETSNGCRICCTSAAMFCPPVGVPAPPGGVMPVNCCSHGLPSALLRIVIML